MNSNTDINGRIDTEGNNGLKGYVENNKVMLERLALHGDNLASAMALTILERGNSAGELS